VKPTPNAPNRMEASDPSLEPIVDVDSLEERLSRPAPAVLETLRAVPGDFAVLGAGGKMGPTLARMLRRGLDEIGAESRRVIAVSRFSSPEARRALEEHGVETLSCDLLDPEAVEALPQTDNLFYLAGAKFGTSGAPGRTWAMNAAAPAFVARRYAAARSVVFSTGCVYPLLPWDGPGADEETPLTPHGEYANSCVGRERVFSHFAGEGGGRVLFFRLCYAVDLRYGVLLDIAQRVAAGEPVDLSMGALHLIWQGDANARAIQCLAHAADPPLALNVTGPERLRVRDLALRFGEAMNLPVRFAGEEASDAWVWDASRATRLFGPPETSLEEMVRATVRWIESRGETYGKPTGFQVRDGGF